MCRSCAGRRDGDPDAGLDLGLELVAEQRQRRVDRRVRRRADEADRRHLVRERHGLQPEPLAGRVREGAGADRLADAVQQVEVLGRAVAVADAGEDALQPRAALATRHALAARLVGVEAGERQGRHGDVRGLVHHHDRPRAGHRPGRADELVLVRQVELVGEEPRRRAAAGDERLELVVVANALAELLAVDHLAERRRAVDDLEDTRPLDVPGDRDHAGAGRRLAADGRVGGGAVDAAATAGWTASRRC